MKTKQELLIQAARRFTQKMIRADSEGWPPDSLVGFYQPVRPHERASSTLENTPPQHKSHKI